MAAFRGALRPHHASSVSHYLLLPLSLESPCPGLSFTPLPQCPLQNANSALFLPCSRSFKMKQHLLSRFPSLLKLLMVPMLLSGLTWLSDCQSIVNPKHLPGLFSTWLLSPIQLFMEVSSSCDDHGLSLPHSPLAGFSSDNLLLSKDLRDAW